MSDGANKKVKLISLTGRTKGYRLFQHLMQIVINYLK